MRDLGVVLATAVAFGPSPSLCQMCQKGMGALRHRPRNCRRFSTFASGGESAAESGMGGEHGVWRRSGVESGGVECGNGEQSVQSESWNYASHVCIRVDGLLSAFQLRAWTRALHAGP